MPRNERLRLHRIQHNWRQQDLADQLSTSLITIQRWERGYQQPSAYYRAKLCELFGTSAQELGLLEAIPTPTHEATTTEQPDATPPEEIALWTVPYARNPHFTGRDDLLDQLAQQLSLGEGLDQSTSMRQTTALTQSHAIKGLGGIGKTQIAVEYAYRSQEQGRYTHTLWINAASEEAILASFTALIDLRPTLASNGETDQHKLVTAIIRWLQECPDPWLLIFDNADDLSLIPPYLPSRGNGSILLTTRASAVGALASSIEVDCMGLMEGAQLLLRRAQRETSASADEIDEATNIVVMLAQYPLALDQAGAYIEETRCALHDYVQIYQKHRLTLLARRGKQATGYPESVATTWSLSFQRVEQANPAAAELLRLCAFLAPDHIPEELLTEGALHWPPTLQEAVANPFMFNQMLEILLAFSLVKRLTEKHLLSIHRLVQVVQMERLSPQEQHQWAERLVLAVHTIFPQDATNPLATWPQSQRYLDQAQVCDTLIQEYQLLQPEAADLLNRVGRYLYERALYAIAEPLFQRALRIREQLLGPEHLLVAESLSHLADLYQMQGKYVKAELLFQRALSIQEQQVGTEDPLVATSLHNLASLYWQQRKYEQAEPLSLQALYIREQQLGPEHPLVATALNNLATLYAEQGKYEQAEPLHLRALHIQKLQLGTEHPEVATSFNNLAFLYYQQGKYEQAEPLFQQAQYICELLVGPDHPNVAYPLHGRAILYYQQGKYEQAESLFQRALHIREQQLGPNHFETAKVLLDFARLQQAQGHLSEAASLYRRALTTYEQVLGPSDPTTIATREHLHTMLVTLGKPDEAAVLEPKQPEQVD